jgi:hypothetical protein
VAGPRGTIVKTGCLATAI